MLGWCADFFRFWWGLLYWNVRKTWFRLRRGRGVVPCQSLSDSGRAFETACEACALWQKPARFKRVCPLLVDTEKGLRCSANTADVRPFWLRAFGFYGGAALGVYGVGALAVFIFLRTVGYPVSIVHVTFPPLWHKVGQARGWFFLDRSSRAFADGRTSEGLLYLANAYEFDPSNYAAGLSLAKILQTAQPTRSDEVFRQLLHDHPTKRHATAQEWFRALLPRGSFDKIGPMARDEILSDPAQAPVWVRALIFATRQMRDDALLRELIANPAPAAQAWRNVFETELLLRAGHTTEARRALVAAWPQTMPAFTVFYRANTLVELHEPFAALVDVLGRSAGRLDGEATVTVQLDAFAEAEQTMNLRRRVNELLAPRYTAANLNLPKILCAHLIRYPNPEVFARLLQKVQQDNLPMNTETAGVWFSLLCTAGAMHDGPRLAELTNYLRSASKTPFVAISGVAGFFRSETAERRITAFLPVLPLPLEVTYALLERYLPNGRGFGATASTP